MSKTNAHLLIEFNLLNELIQLLDKQIINIHKLSSEVEDPDGLGYYDNGEHIVGLGFVACQTYITTVCGNMGVSKRKSFSVGPSHAGGNNKVEIINHAANYWKHNNEWDQNNNDKRKVIIEKSFESINVPINMDYPLSNVLYEISLPDKALFQSVLSSLEVWKVELEKIA